MANEYKKLLTDRTLSCHFWALYILGLRKNRPRIWPLWSIYPEH